MERFVQLYRIIDHAGSRLICNTKMITSSPAERTLTTSHLGRGGRSYKGQLYLAFSPNDYGLLPLQRQAGVFAASKPAVGAHAIEFWGVGDPVLAEDIQRAMQPAVFWKDAMGYDLLELLRS